MTVVLAGVLLAAASASPASAGSHSWNYYTDHDHYGSQGATSHGQYAYSNGYRASISHVGWSGLCVDEKFIVMGQAYTTGYSCGSNSVSGPVLDSISSHRVAW